MLSSVLPVVVSAVVAAVVLVAAPVVLVVVLLLSVAVLVVVVVLVTVQGWDMVWATLLGKTQPVGYLLAIVLVCAPVDEHTLHAP